MKKILLVLGVFGVVLGLVVSNAHALGYPLNTARTYQVTCSGTVHTLAAGSGQTNFQAFTFWNNSTTPVFVGGSDVNTTTTGMPYCTDTTACKDAKEAVDMPPASLSCKTSGSSVTVTVLAASK